MTIVAPVNTAIERTELQDALQWLTGATMVTAFGLVLIAIIASVVSYFVTSLAWRAWIARKRKARVLRARGRKLAG